MGDLSLNKEAAVNGSHVTTLPELLEQPIQLKDFAANSNSKNTATDDLKLRLVGSKGALTWKDFVSSSEDDFSGHLQNDLKNETLADKKMFILIRLSRQLKKLCAEAEEELSKKEKGQGISECIDTKLLKFISLRIGEAERLTEQALSASTTTYSLSRYLPEFSTKDKPGETEVILFACRNMLEEFLVFCQTENSKRKLKSMQEKGSMLDVFASKIQNLQDPLMIIDQHACDYIIENLYIDALYHGYLKFNSLPLSWKIYDPELAKTKRLKIQTSLVQYCEIAKEEKQDQNAFYDRLMSETDTLAKDLGVITPVLAYYWGKAQKSVDFCEDVHTVLRIQASSAAPTASGRHQKCFSKK